MCQTVEGRGKKEKVYTYIFQNVQWVDAGIQMVVWSSSWVIDWSCIWVPYASIGWFLDWAVPLQKI